MRKHDPGTWEHNCHQVFSADGKLVTTLNGIFSKRNANGNLIAAAPELLEAVKALIFWCPRGWSLELDQSLTAARAAIAKAEGGVK